MTHYYPGDMIISFEGLDCCFKETNYRNFLDNLLKNHNEKYVNIFYESFPRYGTDMCIPVEKWLQGKIDRDIVANLPLAKNTLYAIDRMNYWHEVSEELDMEYDCNTLYQYKQKNKRACFVFDRYSTSNIIYNPLNGDFNSHVTKEEILFEESFFKVPRPDIVVWMRATDFEFIREGLAAKQNKDKNELDLTYLEKVWKRSEMIIKEDINIFSYFGTHIIPININNPDLTARSKEEIAHEIEEKVYHMIDVIIDNRY